MREIKFRAWDKKTKEMVRSGSRPSFSFWKWVDYDSSTPLMQYTGLKDSKGVEIYEGDIVHYSMSIAHGPREEGNGEVFWYDKTGAFLIDRSGLWSIVELTFCEIIGDVYRNPDLCPEKAT